MVIRSNLKQLNELLLAEQQEEIQGGVMRVFLECLHGTVGYSARYSRDPETGEEGQSAAPKFNSMVERFDLVTAAVGDIGINPEDVRYLVGSRGGYRKTHKACHSPRMQVETFHIQIPRERHDENVEVFDRV